MSEDLHKQANELAWSYRRYFDKMIDRGFTPGQITITSIMLSVSQYNIVKGVGAGIAVLTSCLNSIMEQDEIDITKIEKELLEEDDLERVGVKRGCETVVEESV